MIEVTAAPWAMATSAWSTSSARGGTTAPSASASCSWTAGSSTSRPATPSVTSAIGNDREERRERETVRQEAAGRSAVDVEDPSNLRDPRLVEDLLQDLDGIHRSRAQSRKSSNSAGWTASAGTRRGAAISFRISPRRTNLRPPSLMLCSLPSRAQPPIVES